MARRTPLYELHRALGARMVDFGGWDMPLSYGSQIEEHHAVRRRAGVFDVSHMGIVDLRGPDARAALAVLLANDVGKLTTPGKALYGCMLESSGGVLDDLIAYFLGPQAGFRLVVNGATRDRDLAWLKEHTRGGNLEILERSDLALLAIQGPEARERLVRQLPAEMRELALALGPFHARTLGDWFVARTGYTGEDGFEVMLPAAEAQGLWRELNAVGVSSCGLGARDTLRLEAGLNLYGQDMDTTTHPFESALGWTVALEPRERDFIGRRALEAVLEHGSARKLVGLVLEERGVMRAHQSVRVPDVGEGLVTSGTFSPTLERSIALARVPAATGAVAQVDVRGKLLQARVVRPPFVRHGADLTQ
ncbi:MAG TPA: glycine cleavage system aminomethyltransferase GcvT [Steroidobacteraceae bacterium]|nr:glycine cleavage system aminomethyltransferase GcvT [Steroidobacteraceae bacterium]